MNLTNDNLEDPTDSFKLPDYGAAEISIGTYERDLKSMKLTTRNVKVNYKVIKPIEDPDTGLHGYVLQNEKNADDIVISFEGTQKSEGFDQLLKRRK